MVKMKRNGVSKDWKESDVDEMLKRGWSLEGNKPSNDPGISQVEELRKVAESLGLKVHHKAGAQKLSEMIEEAQKKAE